MFAPESVLLKIGASPPEIELSPKQQFAALRMRGLAVVLPLAQGSIIDESLQMSITAAIKNQSFFIAKGLRLTFDT